MKRLKQIINMMAYIMNPFVLRVALLSNNVRNKVEKKYYNKFKELCNVYNITFSDTADFIGKQIATAGFYKYSVCCENQKFFTINRSIHINPDTKTLYILCHEVGHFFTLEEWYSKQVVKEKTIDEITMLAKQITADNSDEKEKAADAYIAELFKRYVDPMDAFVLRVFLSVYVETTMKSIYGGFWFFRKGFKKNVLWVWDFANNGTIK